MGFGKLFKKLAPVIGTVAGSYFGPMGAKIGGSIGSAISGRAATKDAANAQQQAYNQSSQESAEATRQANEAQRQVYGRQEQLYNDQIQRSEPIRHAAHTAQNRLMDVLGLSMNKGAEGYGSANAKFQEQDIKMDPGYQFRLEQGQKALERSAAARGGLFSGRAAKDLTNYAQGAASQEYGNAYNRSYGRFQDERRNLLEPLETLSGRFQGAVNSQGATANNFGNQASNYANQVSNNLLKHGGIAGTNAIGAGDSRASGYVGAANTGNKALTAFNENGGFDAIGRGYDKFKNTNVGASIRGFFSGADNVR